MASAIKRLALQAPAGARLASGASASAGKHALAHAKMWENITLFGVIPVLAIASYMTYEHEKSHHEPPPEFKPYEHMRIRKKNFPFGDGKRSFFHNPERNALPDGYEVEIHH
ncbi:hypothetical protein ONE63_000854 [Megalurothrips usitatus]|uniref:Cytochrome c oxidase subunit 6A, mitochondrial n=1 Tax=Megalurothrips usitatus TaxID=439358 RepID=A0AAV7Y6K6_9NEOP|nr:hypothetical protein ONE63_000854 [Megalurothrips usitatus]